MHKKLRKIIATGLLFTNFFQVAAAALPTVNAQEQMKQHQQRLQNGMPTAIDSQSIAVSTDQLGISGPLNAGVNYSSLTGAYFNGQFLKQISEKMGFNILGEYGDKQYRFNGTIGFLLAAQTLFKISAEQLGQQLPFYFRTGDIEKRVKQNAFGARLQQNFNFSFLNNLSAGAYVAKAPNVRLAPLSFISNGSNCNGFDAGLRCVNERNIAGANSSGADLGLGAYLTSTTYVEGKLYYDSVRYNTIFSPQSRYDRSGYGGGVSAQHLLASNLKFSAGAEIRKIYDTYNLSLSWMPPFTNASGTEFSVFGQRVVSHNQFNNDDTVGLRITFVADRANYQAPVYGLNGTPFVNNIASWISQPAVKMNQVLAISEELVHLAAATISSITPNYGPLSGGNLITITGGNFLSGAMVRIGGQIATITSMTATTLTVIAPPGNVSGGAVVSVTTPDGQVVSLENGYLYTNGIAPIANGDNPSMGSFAGGTLVTITGANFVAGSTTVTIGGITIPANLVTVISPVLLTFITPGHAAGTVMVTVNTPTGTSNPVPGGFTYEAAPTAASLTPTAGSTAGNTTVTVTGTNFATGDTTVTIGGNLVPANLVTVNSATSLSFSTPAHAAGNVAVSVSTSGGSSTVPGGFTYDNAAATVVSLSPIYGPVSGGTAVTLTGTNFVAGNTTVTIGGIVIPVGSVTVNSATSLSFITPAHAAGTVSINVTTPVGSSGFVPGGFTYESVPTLTSLSPIAGGVAGGTVVTLMGTNFVAGDTTVTIGGNIVPVGLVTVNSATSLSFTTPAHAAGTVAVSVATSGGSSNIAPGGFTYENVPTTASLTPASGSVAGATVVTITGTNFIAGNTTVTIGGNVVPASSVAVNSATSLSFSTPAHVAGNVSVSVTTSGGISNTVPGGFTYNAVPTTVSLTPAAGLIAGGTVVTLTGTNFATGDTTVTIGGNVIPVGSVTINSATSLSFTTPAHAAGNVAVNVTTSGGSSNLVPGGFTYTDVPTTISLTPVAGSIAGGTLVTLTGTNFIAGNTTVTIGGNVVPVGSVTVNSTTSLSFSTPAHAAGNVSVSVATSGGSSNTIPGGFTYADVPTTVSLLPTAGPISGGTMVTVVGTNFVAGNTTVAIGGNVVPASSVTVNSATSLSFITPVHVAGNVSVSVATSGGSSNIVPGGYVYADVPTIALLSPVAGPAAGSTLVTLTGTNFIAGITTVTIGGNVIPAGSVIVNSATSLSFNTPAHVAGNVSVNVATPGGSSNNVAGGFTYADLPTAALLTPIAGSTAGGTVVTITGTNFIAGDTTVTIDGNVVPVGLVTVNSATSLSFTTPAHGAGNVSVSVSTSGGNSNTVTGGFTYANIPTTNSLTPVAGPIAGGTTVTISGTNFIAGNTTVTIGGNVIPVGSVTVNSATSLSFSTPTHAAGNVSVSVATSGGDSNTVVGGFTYEGVPTIALLAPAAGSIAGGTLVTLTGTHFAIGDTTVTIGGNVVPAGSVTVNSATSLSFTTPAHAAGNVAVSVATSGGNSNDVSGGFTYEDIPTAGLLTPVAGPIAGGTTVTISGTNFIAGNTTVTIGGNVIPASSVTVNSATSLSFNTPAHVAGNVSVSVATSGGDSNTVVGGFTYEGVPTIALLAPAAGPIAGGTLVTLTGTHFAIGDTTVTIGGNVVPAGSVTVNSATSLSFTTPAHAAGNVAVSVATSGGNSNDVSGGFTYEDIPTAGLLTPAAGPTAGGTLVTLTGTNFISGDTTVTIGGNIVPAGSVTVNSAVSLTFTTPAHVAGNVAVSVATSGGSSNSVSGGFNYAGEPTTSSLAPTAGVVAGGTLVTIVGTNFVAGNTTVTIGGNVVSAGSVTVNSATSLSFTTPAHVAGNVSVSVTTPGGSSNIIPGGFTYNDTAATVISLSPIYGSVTGGTTVTLIGTNFVAGSTTVAIGGNVVPAGSVTVNSATSLSFTTPANAAGNVAVSVSTPAGVSGFVPGGFTYEDVPSIVSLAPTAGPIAGGTLVTLIGTNFVAGDTTVAIGGNVIPAGSVIVNSATSLSFTTPAHVAGNVSVSVATSAGGISNNVPGGFTYNNTAATVTSLTPIAGPLAGGTVVTITGTNFVAGNTTVTIGGNVVPTGSVTVNSATSLSFATPIHIAGNVSVYVTTPVGSSDFVPGGFTYENVPTTALLTPIAGATSGGTLVTLTGTNFIAGDTTVTIGGNVVAAGAVTVNSATSLSFSTPAHAAGNVSVSVATSGGSSNLVSGGFTYEDVPTTSLLIPAAGPVAGGTIVTLTGTNFALGDTTVTIGGNVIPSGSVTVNSATSLSFTTPAHVAGNVSVSVATSGGSSNSVLGGFTYENVPTAASLIPIAGPTVGGTLVTLTGTNFVASDTAVTIGGNVVATGSVTVNSATSLSFITPAHAAGNVAVSVATSGGSSNTVSGGFTYESVPTANSLTPTAGPVAGGTTVTIIGTNFIAGDTAVTIGGNVIPAGSVTVNSANSLSFTTPAHVAGNVSVSVATSGGSSSPVLGGFTYENIPTAASLTPIAGPTVGGTLVTVTGTNFVAGNTVVTIGGNVVATGSVTVNSATSLSFITPAHAAGNVAVSVATSGGSSNTVSGGFTYESVPTANSLTPTAGPVAGGTTVTIIGTNFIAGDTTVTIGGNVIPAGSVTVNSASSLSFTTPAHVAGNVSVSVATSGGNSNLVIGGFTYENVPTATSLIPAVGPIAGGTLVTITGTNFVLGDTTVTIGGTVIPVGLVTVNSATSLSFITPAHAAGTVSVSVATSGGSSNTVVGGFTYEGVPTTTSLTPLAGPIAGGTTVTITGTNFIAGDTSVLIGGAMISAGFVTVNSATSLSFSTPAHVAGNVSVSVFTSGGTSNTVVGGFTYEGVPTTTSLIPTAGPIAGGTLVTLTGTNFATGDTTVTIDGNVIPVGAVTVNSATSLTFITPAHAAGTVSVSVATSGGSSNNVPGGFIYEDLPTTGSLTPASGPIAGGTLVTLTGTNFVAGDTTVTIGGTLVPVGSVTVSSDTSLSFNTPAHAAGNVSVIVTTSGGSSNAVPGGYTYRAVPITTSLTPTAGPIAGGTLVTVTGANFAIGATTVTIGGNVVAVGSVTVNSATSLSFITPAHAAGNVSVSVTTSGGSSNNVPGGFTYVAVPTAASLTPTSGTTAGGTTVSITGTNFVVANTTVTIGGNVVPVGSVTVSSATSLSFSTPGHSAGNVSVSVATSGGSSNTVSGGYTYLAPSLSSCTAPIPSLLGIQLLTCVGTNLTLFQTTFLKASGSAACSTFPTQSIVPTVNILGLVLITATDIPAILSQGLIGCNIQVCSNSSCNVVGGVAGPALVSFGL